MSPRQAGTQFTAEQHHQYYHDAAPRLKSTCKPHYSMHDLHFYGKGTRGYFGPMPELLNYDPQGKTSFVREPLREPLCGHGIIATTHKSTLQNTNKGKRFIRCAKGNGAPNDCG